MPTPSYRPFLFIMSSELIPSDQPSGICDPITGMEFRAVRIADECGNIRQSVGDPDRITREVVRGFERRHVSYVVTESSRQGQLLGGSPQEPLTQTPIPATQTRPFRGSSLDLALQALQAGPSQITVRPKGQNVASPEALSFTPPNTLGTIALQSILLTKDHFVDGEISVRYAGRMLGSLQSIGMWTFADMLAMGRSQMLSHMAGATSSLRDKSWRHIDAVVKRHTGMELPDERAPLAKLPEYYDDIVYATPALVLPQDGFPYYRSLAPLSRPGLRFTVGDLAEAYKTGLLNAFPYKRDAAHLKRLEGFVRHIVIKGLVEPFNAAKR